MNVIILCVLLLSRFRVIVVAEMNYEFLWNSLQLRVSITITLCEYSLLTKSVNECLYLRSLFSY